MARSRFAPTASGPAHAGTLLAALLCWLDARSRGDFLLLRIEDLDPDRCRPAHASALREDLAWFGLDFDAWELQSSHRERHEAALDALARLGLLYPSPCSRGELRRTGRRAPDGGWAYDNRDRARPLPAGGWRCCREPLRVRLPDGLREPCDEGGILLAQDPAAAFGDPVLRRGDGCVCYHLACVVDDAAAGIDRIVRGRDLASACATQAALQELLGLPRPGYRHHFLLLEDRGAGKLAKSHGSRGGQALRSLGSAQELCGRLACLAGLRQRPDPCTPGSLLADFSWDRIRTGDAVWEG